MRSTVGTWFGNTHRESKLFVVVNYINFWKITPAGDDGDMFVSFEVY